MRRFASQNCQETPPVASSADLGCLAPPYNILYIHRVGKVCRRVRSAAELASCKLWGASRLLKFGTSIEFLTRSAAVTPVTPKTIFQRLAQDARNFPRFPYDIRGRRQIFGAAFSSSFGSEWMNSAEEAAAFHGM